MRKQLNIKSFYDFYDLEFSTTVDMGHLYTEYET